MKKILFSVMAVVLCLGLMGGAFAWFSDTAESTGNTFTAGTLSIVLTGENNEGGSVSTGAFFTVPNMAAGDTATAYVEVKNDGDLDMLFRVYVDGVTGTAGFDDVLLVTVTLRPNENVVTDYSLYGPLDGVVLHTGALSSFIGVANAKSNVGEGIDPLWPGYVAVYEIVIELPSGTVNAWQGATLTGDLQIDAVQAANQDLTDVIWTSD